MPHGVVIYQLMTASMRSKEKGRKEGRRRECFKEVPNRSKFVSMLRTTIEGEYSDE